MNKVNLPGMGKNQWIKYRLNRTYSNPYPEKEIEIYLEPGGPSNIVSWDVAAKNVALDLHSNYDNLYVAMSGGIDSEFVAQTFLNLKIPFTPIIGNIENINELDIWWALKWCKDNNKSPVILDIKIEEWINRFTGISSKYCSRFGQATGTMSYINDYVINQQGNLVTGAGFIEYYPDENLSYMHNEDVNIFDAEVHNLDGSEKQGYILHEPDVLQAMMYPSMPFNFLSWTPEIVLSYIFHRDMNLTSAENKSKIMNCLPRPKNIGVPNFFFRMQPQCRKWNTIRMHVGKTECSYLGTKEYLINLLSKGQQ